MINQVEGQADPGNWIPPYAVLCKAMGVDMKTDLSKSPLPSGSLLMLLLKTVLKNSSFHAKTYLEDYPDVRAAVEAGKIKNPKEHYAEFGYFEGRINQPYKVDELWYRSRYPDVDSAIRSGKVKSAAQHYQSAGMAEMRAPNAAVEPVIAMWREAMKAKG